jgi:folate-binding protein YgfZ
MADHPVDDVLRSRGATFAEVRGIRVVADFGDAEQEYRAAIARAAIHDARERGVIEVSGTDRAGWLHNLVTNTIKDLAPGQGNYAFATNVKGRILFDCNMLVLEDAVWLDVDRRWVAQAIAHLDRYIITEEVTLADRSGDLARIALLGPESTGICESLGVHDAGAMASLNSVRVKLAGKQRLMVRHDFAGVFGMEIYVEAAEAAQCWESFLEMGQPPGLRPIGRSAVHVLRVEAGIPASGEDIDEEVLPAETGQIERGISYVKGCYLGQEVIERMRSRGSQARTLVGLHFTDNLDITPGTSLMIDGNTVGRLTSVCRSYALHTTIGLGYVKTPHGHPGTRVTLAGDPRVEAEVAALPFRVPNRT